MKKLVKSENIAADAPSATTTTTEAVTANAATAWAGRLPDPERGERMSIEISNLKLLKLLPKDERLQVLDGLWGWMVETPVSERPLSDQADMLLNRLMDAQRKSARLYRQRVVAQMLKAERRRNRLNRAR